MTVTDDLLGAVVLLYVKAARKKSLDEAFRDFETAGLMDHIYKSRNGTVEADYSFTSKAWAILGAFGFEQEEME